MYAKNLILLAAAGLVAESVAVNVHRHGHAQVHKNLKKDLVLETEVETVTEWVTVTYDPSKPTTTANAKFVEASHKSHTRTRKFSKAGSAPSSSSSAAPAPTSSPSSVAPAPTTPSSSPDLPPTTLVPQLKPTEVEQAASSSQAPPPPPTTTQAPPPPATTEAAAPAPTTASGNPAVAPAPPASGGRLGRGLAYNDPNLVSAFAGSGSHATWKYNWAQTNDGNDGLHYIPMLWSPRQDFVSTWQANADKAIAAGSQYLLSFNECDNAGQCNMSPADAAAAHQQHMNPYAGKAQIVAPAVTNSNIPGEGPDWLQAWVEACNGQCAYDFCATHWYDNDLSRFYTHVKKIHDICGKPVWITEFAPVGSLNADDVVSAVIKAAETDPDYDFIYAFSYFMVAEGPNNLVSNGAPNALGNKFAYGS